jgi:hypothetical protein
MRPVAPGFKKEATKPASFNFMQQQSRFDKFIEVYGSQRPHQAIGMRYPAELYTPSAHPYRDPEPPQYPLHDRTVCVTRFGRICIGKRKINLSQVFSGQLVGSREVDEKIWLVSFMEYDLGFFDHEAGRVECAPNPFAPNLLPMSPDAGINRPQLMRTNRSNDSLGSAIFSSPRATSAFPISTSRSSIRNRSGAVPWLA